MLKVELLNKDENVIDTENDWIVYTNAKIYADIIDKVGDKKTSSKFW